jgi:hypothetical protein
MARLLHVSVASGLVLCLASPLLAQSPPQPPTSTTPPGSQTSAGQPAVPDLTRTLDKVKRALRFEPPLRLDDEQLRFYVQVVATAPRFEDFVGSYDLRYGPVRGAPMTHQEFLNMVTPKELYGSGGIKASEMLQFALVNWLGQAIIKKGIEELREARNDAEARAIRERIDRELAALRGK